LPLDELARAAFPKLVISGDHSPVFEACVTISRTDSMPNAYTFPALVTSPRIRAARSTTPSKRSSPVPLACKHESEPRLSRGRRCFGWRGKDARARTLVAARVETHRAAA
jgi:hypothetical protein